MENEKIRTTLREGAKKVKEPLLKVVIRTIFSRLFFVALMILIQLYYLYAAFRWMDDHYSKYFLELNTLIAGVIIIMIINSKSSESYKLSWALIVSVLPLMGVFLYLYSHFNPIDRRPFRRLQHNIQRSEAYSITSRPVKDRIRAHDTTFQKLSGYIEQTGKYPTYDNTEVKYYAFGDEVLEDMCEALSKAESFIFLEYFIIDQGIFWDRILKILEQKAEEGIEVRVLYDDLGCVSTLPRKYYKQLRHKGIMSHAFGQIHPFFSTYYNNRDHRKMMIIDGTTAFSGGINLADEYINQRERFGVWKDNSFRLKGDGVRNYTLMFLQMWNIDRDHDPLESWDSYLNVPVYRIANIERDGFVIPYGDGPHCNVNTAKNIYVDIINNALHSVCIMTPYLVPDHDILHAIKHAARSGIRVDMILPYIPDKKIINLVSKSYYRELIDAGVHIHEYTPGFIHTKLVMGDGEIAATGSVNLDYRSLYLHYECGSVIYRNNALGDIVDDFQSTLNECEEITLGQINSWSIFFTIFTSILRVFAPLF